MKKVLGYVWTAVRIIFGCALFGAGFNMFMVPHDMNAGGISGLSMILVHLLNFGTVGTATMLINVPLFVIGGWKIGKSFFTQSLLGMAASALAIDALCVLPVPQVDPLLAALYGGALCGLGLGIVFACGASTGGSDIIVRLLKRRWRDVPIGTINTFFDLTVVTLTGLAFGDISRALYSGIAILVMGKVIDGVVYRFDYSKVALIVTKKHEEVTQMIGTELGRGATLLHGEGAYSREDTEVVLTAVKRQQMADLKRLVVEVDPNAFIIVQEAHQVLGDGFSRYSKDEL